MSHNLILMLCGVGGLVIGFLAREAYLDYKASCELIREIEAREASVAKVEAPATAVVERAAVVTREERTYTTAKGVKGEASFFSDMYRANSGDIDARSRLERHQREARVEGELESRAVASGGFAGLVVPQYLVDQAALALRNGRPIANVCTRLPLPDQGMSLILPRATTGASTAIQASENSAVSNTDEVWTNVTLPVATISGSQIVSRQSLERGIPGLDELIYLDLAGAYAANLDTQVIAGSGTAGQMLGIAATSGINAATAFGAAPTASTFYSKLAGQIAAVAGAGTAVSPKVIAVHPRRWGWLTTLVDTAGRPLVVPAVDGAFNALGVNALPGAYSGDGAGMKNPTDLGARVVGYLHGLPVITDANIPTNIGVPSEDYVLILDTAQPLLFENGDGAPKFMQFDATNVTTLGVTIVGYNYAAFTAGRYPSAIGKVGGVDTVAAQGLVAPSF